MHDKLEILLNKIDLNKEFYSYFYDGKLDKVVINKDLGRSCFKISLNNTLPLNIYLELKDKVIATFSNDKINDVNISIKCENIDYSLLIDYYKNIIKNIGMKASMFIDNTIYVDDDIKIEVLNKVEEKKLKEILDTIKNELFNAGFDNDIKVVINKVKNEEIKKEIESETKDLVIAEEKHEDNVVIGNDISDLEVNREIRDMIVEDDNIVIECYIFGAEVFESSKSNFKILTLKISDNTDSIFCKIFSREDKEFNEICSKLKVGKWIKLRGNTKNDQYSHDLVLNARDIIIIPSKDVEITDDEEIKRVELHAHTMMSQMDAVTKLDLNKHTCELVEKAIKMGYKGIAITDHNGCQAFPVVYGIINDYNKKIEDKSKHFKGLYGVELSLVDDTVNVVVRPTEDALLSSTYVVFDTETTGFNAGGIDQMIEIGAVKIKEGQIIDRFDELINPGRHIPDKITELTCITDEMVKDCDNEENVTKRFLEWIGDCPLVAHNAKFDISFLEMAMKKYNLGEFKSTVIDTLELSRIIDQGFARHSLSALVKRYNVPWDEEAHHRADYDAEGTALVFSKMLDKLHNQNFRKISDLDNLIAKNEIHKFGRTYHFNAIALNKKGLKNLFKIISLANTTYFYKTPRIPRSKLNELRDGLLIGSG